jgi:hypothetical protein
LSSQPTEDELRAAYEAELARLSTTDVMAQAVVSLLNIGARRLVPAGEEQAQSAPPERDLAQARDAIDAVRALLEILERSIPQELAPLRDALSRLQMAYAREIANAPAAPGAAAPPQQGEPPAGGEGGSPSGGAGGSGGGPADTPAGSEQQPAQERPPGPGPAEQSGRLWVPGR